MRDGVETGSFAEFFDDHYLQLLGVLAVALQDRDLAEEAAQEAFTKACARWNKVRRMRSPGGWVYTVALNAARSHRRRQATAQRFAPFLAVESDHGHDDTESAIAGRLDLLEQVSVLPGRQREAVLLRFVADLSYADVATAMGCSVGTVKSTLHAALNALRVETQEAIT